jgi:hypothetical protein
MKTSVTLTFTALFIGVAAVYWYYGNPLNTLKPEPPAASEPGSLKLLDLEKDAMTFIQIQKPETKETVTIEREGENWVIKYPISYLADNMMINGLSTALRVSNKARRLVREKGWEEYGLLKPQLKIGVEAQGLSKRKYLLLGDQSPVAETIFARWEDEEDYFLLDSRLKESFDRSIYSLREKRLIRLSLNDLQKIHVRTFTEGYELALENSEWYWTEPVSRLGKKITREQMYEILMALRELYVKEFLDGQPVQEVERGFTVAGPHIQVWDKAGKTSTVRIGREVAEHDAFYGLIDGEQVVLEIARGNIQKVFGIFEAALQDAAAAPAPVVKVSPSPSGAMTDPEKAIQTV